METGAERGKAHHGQVKKIAAEYYDNRPYPQSWGLVLWDFISNERLGPFSHLKRTYKKVKRRGVEGSPSLFKGLLPPRCKSRNQDQMTAFIETAPTKFFGKINRKP